MTGPASASIEAPAKVNLGLEILGKRPDGYHEIRTVMAMIDLTDTVSLGAPGAVGASRLHGVNEEANLIARALALYRAQAPGAPEWAWSIRKRIPVAAGLGGASSNAAAALRLAHGLAARSLASRDLRQLAERLGSDVPFFLDGPAAVACGRGTELTPLRAPALDLLLVVPRLDIPGKTGLLYSLLEPGDYTDGGRVDLVVRAIEANDPLPIDALGNAFIRALGDYAPGIRALQACLRHDIGLGWGLSGAGPAHYVVCHWDQHEEIRVALTRRFPGWLTFHSVRTLVVQPEVAVTLAHRAW